MLRVLRAKRRAFVIYLFIIVAFFLGGFIVIPGAGVNQGPGVQNTQELGSVDGIPISRFDFDAQMATQTQGYKNQFGSDPPERDLRALQVQAWRSLVSQSLLASEAQKLGLEAHDSEVVLSLRTSPPPQVTALPSFQTDGQFDPAKYQSALIDPNINWAPFEELMRAQLPVRKLQERLLTSIKMSEQELRQAYRNRFERVGATLVLVPPDAEATPPAPSEEDLTAVYEANKNRFSFPHRVQLEVLLIPKEYGDDAVREAQQLAQSLADRVRAGEDFAQLARDYSEGGGAGRGGEIQQTLRISEFGPTAGPLVSALEIGQITDAIRDGGRFLVFKLRLKQPLPGTSEQGYVVSQIVVRIRPSDEVRRPQFVELAELRRAEKRGGLGKAASDRSLVTGRTAYFGINDSPPELFTVPAASDWGLNAKKGDVGPIFDGTDDFALIEVIDVKSSGVASLEEVRGQLQPLYDQNQRVDAAKSVTDAVSEALGQGRTLEQAAGAANLTANPIAGLSRYQLDPSLAPVPEVAGAIFATPAGETVGPIRTLYGWYFARVDNVTPADPELYDQIKGQVSSEMLQNRQQVFLNSYLTELRGRAKIKDERFPR